jgi:hypothetical protein
MTIESVPLFCDETNNPDIVLGLLLQQLIKSSDVDAQTLRTRVLMSISARVDCEHELQEMLCNHLDDPEKFPVVPMRAFVLALKLLGMDQVTFVVGAGKNDLPELSPARIDLALE